MKKLYFLDEQEKNRILNLHTEATKKQYLSEKRLLNESAPVFTLIKQFFRKLGKDIDLTGVNKYIGEAINNTLKQLPDNVTWIYGNPSSNIGTYVKTGTNKYLNTDQMLDILKSKKENIKLSQKDVDEIMGNIPETIYGIKADKTEAKFKFANIVKKNLNSLVVPESEKTGNWMLGAMGDFFTKQGLKFGETPIKYTLNVGKTIGGLTTLGYIVGVWINRGMNIIAQGEGLQKYIEDTCLNLKPSENSTIKGLLNAPAINLTDEEIFQSAGRIHTFKDPTARQILGFDEKRFASELSRISNAVDFCKVWDRFNKRYVNDPSIVKKIGSKPNQTFVNFLITEFSTYITSYPGYFFDYIVLPLEDIMLATNSSKAYKNMALNPQFEQSKEQKIFELLQKKPNWSNPKCTCVLDKFKNNNYPNTKIVDQQGMEVYIEDPIGTVKAYGCDSGSGLMGFTFVGNNAGPITPVNCP